MLFIVEDLSVILDTLVIRPLTIRKEKKKRGGVERLPLYRVKTGARTAYMRLCGSCASLPEKNPLYPFSFERMRSDRGKKRKVTICEGCGY